MSKPKWPKKIRVFMHRWGWAAFSAFFALLMTYDFVRYPKEKS